MYKPDQHVMPARVLTTNGWMTGNFHVARRERLVDHLNKSSVFVTLTEVATDGETWNFMALRKDAIMMILPPADHDVLPTPTTHVPQRVRCLLGRGDIIGTVSIIQYMRISDYFGNAPDFVPMMDVVHRNDRTGDSGQQHGQIVVRSSHIFAVGETAPDGSLEPVNVDVEGPAS